MRYMRASSSGNACRTRKFAQSRAACVEWHRKGFWKYCFDSLEKETFNPSCIQIDWGPSATCQLKAQHVAGLEHGAAHVHPSANSTLWSSCLPRRKIEGNHKFSPDSTKL